MNPIVKSYIPLVEFLGKVLPKDYEIALHDCSEKGAYAIVAIANGHISGRKLGAPVTEKGLEFISSKVYEKQDYVENYRGIDIENNHTISSTMFLKDENGELVGMLCINHSTSQCNEVVDNLLKLLNVSKDFACIDIHSGNVPESETPEVFTNNISDVVASVINSVLPIGTSPERLTADERIKIVRALKEKGVFEVKGAVQETARQLQCSEPSIYRYLKNV